MSTSACPPVMVSRAIGGQPVAATLNQFVSFEVANVEDGSEPGVIWTEDKRVSATRCLLDQPFAVRVPITIRCVCDRVVAEGR